MTTTESKPIAGGGDTAGGSGSPDATYESHLTADEQKWIDKKKYAWIFSIVPAAIPLIIWGVAEWMKAIDA
ncbi:MAG: alkane 1-monooxygenase, partial [Corynebacterium variabile]